ncbi:sulfur carrier protein [Promicromonospora umidemergens]|uniref:Sulfur carrier protein n=1 Tax=Promicromonospora umidemergens TaxID=629679 RepID=A0ABP8WX60_9MICO|nr:sulfur carrier protein ThiS [Promicromonospora umidemergens]MCP2285472.1 sulfur carrier protein [Promicromonospora umidemergens]
MSTAPSTAPATQHPHRETPEIRQGPAGTAVVNGEPYRLDGELPVIDLVARLLPGLMVDGAPQGVAVALDDAVVPRGAWSTTTVRPGDRVEVVTAVQGG